MPDDTRRKDVIVIGAGQGGGPLAAALAAAGRRVALIERSHVGGTCVNTGCTPTKALVASAAVAHLARRSSDWGVSTGDVRVDMPRVRKRMQEIVESFRGSSHDNYRSTERLELVFGVASFTGPQRIDVATDHGTQSLEAEIIVLDTGQRPQAPPIDGLDRVPFLTNESILQLDRVPEHLIVLGGGYVGLEFGQMVRRFGSEVTVLQRAPRIAPREDEDISAAVAEILEREGMRILTDSEARRVEQAAGGIRVEWDRHGIGGAVEGSHLLVATGRTPNTDGLNLDAAGVETDEAGYIRVDDRLRTSADGVYAIGDVTGGPAFTHVSYDDFRILRAYLLDGGGRTTRDRIPNHTMYTDPQLGRVGLTESEARERYDRVGVAKMPARRVARGIETGHTEGLWKAVVDLESEQIVGAAILGAEGGEVAAVLQVAMMGGLPYTALRDGMFAHPTYTEGLNNLFADVEERG